MFDTDAVFLVVDIFGIFIGSLTGALVGLRSRYDIMGIWFLALVTGLGGGMIRDIMLPLGPPLALTNPVYLPAVMVAAGAVALWGRHINGLSRMITVLDAIALSNFAVAGTLRAFDAELSFWSAILLGMITAVGGGIIRDMMTGQTPAIFQQAELYGLAALGVCIAVVLFRSVGFPREALVVIGIGTGVFLRLGSIKWGWLSWAPKHQ